MRILSYNQRETVLPSSDVPVINVEKFEVRQTLDENGISHSSLTSVGVPAVLDLPFRAFSMQSYNETGEIARLHFMSPMHDTSFDAFDRVSGDLQELSLKVDHISLMEKVVSSSAEVKSELSNN